MTQIQPLHARVSAVLRLAVTYPAAAFLWLLSPLLLTASTALGRPDLGRWAELTTALALLFSMVAVGQHVTGRLIRLMSLWKEDVPLSEAPEGTDAAEVTTMTQGRRDRADQRRADAAEADAADDEEETS